MATFNESEQPRSAGKFTDKTQSAPETVLSSDAALRAARDDEWNAQDRFAALSIEAAKQLIRDTYPDAAAFTITTRSGGYPIQSEMIGGSVLDADGKHLEYIEMNRDIADRIKGLAQDAGADWIKLNLPRYPVVNAACLVKLA